MEQDVKPESIVLKFERFRSIAEILQKKYKEAATVIECLKEENNLSKDIEKNLRSQLFEAQTRLINIEENQKNFFKERNEKFEEATCLLEKKIAELEKQLKENQEKTKQLSDAADREIELQKQVGQLNAALKEKDGDFDILKTENKMLENEKFHIITEYEEKITQMQDELKSSKKEFTDLKVYSDRALQMYREQVKEYERVIQDFEKGENRIGEYELPPKIFNKPQSILKENINQSKQDKRVTWADSTVSSFSEESGSKFDLSQSIDINSELCDELSKVEALMDKKSTKDDISSKKTFMPKVKKDSNRFLKVGGKQKPQLDFVSTSEDNATENLSEKISRPKKRRLFVDNGDFLM